MESAAVRGIGIAPDIVFDRGGRQGRPLLVFDKLHAAADDDNDAAAFAVAPT